MIPGGCTKYAKAPGVSCNKPFKAIFTEKYEAVGIHQEKLMLEIQTLCHACTTINWILDARYERICNSFVACALTATDGSEDNKIHCLKEGQCYHACFAMLVGQMKLINNQAENPCVVGKIEIAVAAALPKCCIT